MLEAIEEHWKHNLLVANQQQNLKILSEGCLESLHGLEGVLESHKSLGMQKKRIANRWTWAATNLAPIRKDLSSSALHLSIFHNTVT